MSNPAPPPPPPHLKPPPIVKPQKKFKTLSIRREELEKWKEIKGEHSWSSILMFIREEYIRLRDTPIISNGSVPIERKFIPRKSVSADKKDLNLRNEIVKELRDIFSRGQEILSPLDPEVKADIKRKREERIAAEKKRRGVK